VRDPAHPRGHVRAVDDARLALYAAWHHGREDARGWEPSEIDAERYGIDFAFPHPCAREVAFYDDDAGGKLVAVGICDETPRALSAAYCYYAPEYGRMSLGTANVVYLVDDAKGRGLPYVYLGYRVSECASLRYKQEFRPHELLVGRPGFGEVPVWSSGKGGR
jgi:arginine-tRNA-protein transferase